MINKDYTYAVIGASNHTEKYWYKVFKDLKESWYKVFPVNPYEKNTILWQKVFSIIPDIKKNINIDIDVVIFVVPPEVTERIIQKLPKLWINKVRMQPWSESDKAIKFCKKNNIECIHNACIMIQKTKHSQ